MGSTSCADTHTQLQTAEASAKRWSRTEYTLRERSSPGMSLHSGVAPQEDETESLLISPNRSPNMLTAHSPSASNFHVRWSIGDWTTAVILFGVGYWLDKTWLPFERNITPQLHDPNISYPHTPNLQAQVPGPLLWHFCLHLPLLVLTLLCKFWPHPAVNSANERWQYLSETLLGLLSSIAVALFFVSLVKVNVGRLRPDFLARCQPSDGVCSGDAHDIMEGRKSFPSGHTSLSFAGLGYLSLWLGMRLAHGATSRAGQLWKVLIAAIPYLLAGWIGLSRIQDYWHHWEDVLVGAFIGHVTAYVLFRARWPEPAGGDLPHTLHHLRPMPHHSSETAGFFKEVVTGACTPCKTDTNV